MTPNAADAQTSGLLDRLAELEQTVSALGAAIEGHAAWLADLQTGATEVSRTIPQGLGDVGSALAQLRAEHNRSTEWLSTLERWVRSCVVTLSELGAQPIGDAAGGRSGHPDILAAVLRRLEVWTVMKWIGEAAVVDEGPLISVVTATIGRPQLRRAVQSVLDQSYGKLELVVVDDSSAGIGALLSDIDDPRLRLVRTPARRGSAAAYNAGLDAVSGDVVSALDDDNIMHADWLRSVAWAFSRVGSIEALYGARIIEDPGAKDGVASGALPTLEFQLYDRRRHELGNYVDRNVIAFRAVHRAFRYDETLPAAVDWDHSLRLFAAAQPMALPVIACYYGTVLEDRISDAPERLEGVRLVRARAHTSRPLRVHVHAAMYPVISETYIGEDIHALQDCGAVVTVSATSTAASQSDDAPPCRLDYEDAIFEANPDVVLMHWATHAKGELETMERAETPFACRLHSFDFDHDSVRQLLEHPLCIAVFAHPHHVPLLPIGVQPLIPVIGPGTVIPVSPPVRDLVISISAGLPKKDFPLLIEAMARLPEQERLIVVARTNGLETLPDDLIRLAAERDPRIEVRVNLQRSESLALMARASVLVYTLRGDSPMGMPMSIIEAMLCGTIVIAPDRPEAYAIVGDQLRAYGDVEDIVRHVRAVAATGPAIERDRAALRERAQRHRDPAELCRLHDALRDNLTAWRLRRST
jgi:glycosyltransferase involved in cell wall biosynthesis